ncbi:MAG: type VI secretion system tip protein VgrG [Cyanobacteria bacterium P01_G01_bin.54]
MPGVVTATIVDLARSTVMNPQYNLLSIDIIQEINKIPTAQLVLLDGDAAQQQFMLSNDAFFKPGNQLAIKLRYEGEPDTTVFAGFIVKQRIRANPNQSILTLTLKDAAIQLTQQRKNAIFHEQDDLAMIRSLLKPSGLQLVTQLPPGQPAKHAEMVQYYCTDWDFMLSRAAANGWWVVAGQGKIHLLAPTAIKGKPIPLVYGLDDIYDLETETDIREQFKTVMAIAWDAQNQTLGAPQTASSITLKQTALDPVATGAALGADTCQLLAGTAMPAPEAKAWAQAHLLKQRLAMLRGRLQVPGRGDLQPGTWLKLEKFNTYFNGETLMTGVRHQVSEAGWQTDVQFGASPRRFAPAAEMMAPPAAGLVPALQGLQIGVVANTDLDPSGMFRVQVELPRLKPTPNSPQNDGLVWARLATLEAGLSADGQQGRGTLFRPEPGDEVVLGFLNDDPRQAVILGALPSAQHQPPVSPTAENGERGIFSKENLKLTFNDQTKAIALETPKQNCLVLGDEAGEIYLRDQHQNQIMMNAEGITLKSEKDITIAAQGKIILQGSQVDVE